MLYVLRICSCRVFLVAELCVFPLCRTMRYPTMNALLRYLYAFSLLCFHVFCPSLGISWPRRITGRSHRSGYSTFAGGRRCCKRWFRRSIHDDVSLPVLQRTFSLDLECVKSLTCFFFFFFFFQKFKDEEVKEKPQGPSELDLLREEFEVCVASIWVVAGLWVRSAPHISSVSRKNTPRWKQKKQKLKRRARSWFVV